MEKVHRGYIPEKLLTDVRLIDRNLREGFLTNEELESSLSKLEDVSEKAVPVEALDPIMEQLQKEMEQENRTEEEVETE